jgi:hypothetical protein
VPSTADLSEVPLGPFFLLEPSRKTVLPGAVRVHNSGEAFRPRRRPVHDGLVNRRHPSIYEPCRPGAPLFPFKNNSVSSKSQEIYTEAPVLFDNSDPAPIFIIYIYLALVYLHLTPVTLKLYIFLTVTPF